MFDYQKVWMLLEIVHKSATAGPAFNWHGQMAAEELMQIQTEAQAAAAASAEKKAWKTKEPSHVEEQHTV